MDKNTKLMNCILETQNVDFEDAIAFSEEPVFWEIDEEDFHDNMENDVEMNDDNIIEYYYKNPEFLEILIDDIRADDELRNWNVNAWRNS